MNELERDRVRQFLLQDLAGQSKQKPGAWFSRLARWLLYSPDATYVFEHTDCDGGRRHCSGEVQRAWIVDNEGIREVQMSPESVPTDRHGLWYRFRRIHFHIGPAGDWVVRSMTDGPRAGGGGCSRVIRDGSSFKMVAEGNWSIS